ncbi:MAG: glycosyltransferase [Spirochaetales bacterium]|nr:glycosyltransferase [Spirochaetales bacterium]
MHIGIFTDTYYPAINGVSASTQYFTEELARRGHHVSIFCPRYTGTKNEVRDHTKPGFSIYRCYGFPFPSHPEHYITFPWFGFRTDIEKLNLDIIHIQHPLIVSGYGIWLAKKLNLPLTQTYHTLFEQYGHYIFLPNAAAKSFVGTVSRILCNMCKVTFAPSPQIKTILEGYGVTTPIELCPTGVDIEGSQRDVNQDLIKRNLGIKNDKKILLFASRMCEEKSADIVIKAFPLILKRFPESVLILTGDGPQKKKIQAQIKKCNLGGKIILKGYLSRPDLYAHYKQADLFVFPSISETQGLVVLEAQMFGTPVVGVSRNGVQMIMENDRGGLLAGRRNPGEIADLCIKLLQDKKLYEQKAKEAFENAQNWRTQKFTDIMESWFLKILDSHKKNTTKKAG